VFGTTAVITDILVKHYRASLWKQFHRLIGSTDVVEGSVGLVANLGTGVYDMFYEPIDGLLDENSTFLSGLSKGGRSLASKTIGGTSAFTSKITGGIGRGVSLLTMDSKFYRTRASRRLNKATNVSEGLYVGTKELGKNIMEGVSGVVVSPYRGWESGGGVGLGLG
jgi:vacuolar protein sorting-associated protein 13A/C